MSRAAEFGGGTLPVLRIELESMKSQFCTMLSEQAIGIDEMVRGAIDAYCEDANLRKIITKHVKEALDQAIAESVNHWMKYGEGRKFIAKCVNDTLEEQIKFWEDFK